MKRLLRMLADLSVAVLVIGGVVMLCRFALVPLFAMLFSLSDPQLVLLRRVGVTVSLFAAYWGVARYYEGRAVTELSFRPVAACLAALWGVGLIGVTLSSLYAMGYYEIVSFRGVTEALPIVGVIVLAVVFEEVLFRGVVFRLVEQHLGTTRALVVQSVIFGTLHMFNEGTSAMTVVSVTLLGALWATIYVYSRNLWVVVANHAAWNVTIFAFGVPLSGQEAWRSDAVFESTYHGPVWLTGGAFGPEDSILNVVVVATAFGALSYRAWRQKRFAEPRPLRAEAVSL